MSSVSDFEVFSKLSDIVVMCHRPLKDFSVIRDVPLVGIAGVPLIVRCLAPWVICGFRRFYIVHDDDKILAAIRNAFPKALLGDRPLQLILVLLSSTEFISEKEALRRVGLLREGTNKQRDIVVTDCTVLLNKEDVVPLVTNFYASMASGSFLLHKPFSGKKDEKEKNKIEEVHASDSSVLVALEDESVSNVTIGASSEQPDASHHRIHYLSTECKEIPSLQMGFVARRPNLEFRSDLNTTGVYMLKAWLFDFVTSQFEGEGNSANIEESLFCIAPAQHWSINRRPYRKAATVSPAATIHELLADGSPEITPQSNWALGNQVVGPIARTPNLSYYGINFNSVQELLPPCWDSFRLVATVITDKKGIGRKVMRINKISDLAIATADVALGLHHLATNGALQVDLPRGVCDDLYTLVHAAYVDDIKYKRNAGGQSNLKGSIVLADTKENVRKRCYMEGCFVSPTAVIGEKVRLLNCIVHDGAVIHENCVLGYCVIEEGAVVSPKTTASCKIFKA